jgi:MFS family permease
VTTLVQGGLIGRLTPRINERHLVVVGTALLAVGLGATPFTPPVVPLLLALGAVACGQGICSPVLSSLISKSSGAHEQGGVLGVSQSAGSLARILGPLWGGVMFDVAGPAGPYVTTGIVMLAAFAVALSLAQRANAAAQASAEFTPSA